MLYICKEVATYYILFHIYFPDEQRNSGIPPSRGDKYNTCNNNNNNDDDGDDGGDNNNNIFAYMYLIYLNT